MPPSIDPTALRHVLRVDALSLVLGSLLAVAGTLTALWAARRRRPTALLWLGSFALLYGLRLLFRTPTFRLGFELPAAAWDRAAAALTYVMPLPLVLFARESLPDRRRRLGFVALGLALFALGATLADAWLRRPYSANLPNNLIAVVLILVLMGALFRPGLAPSLELNVVRTGAVAMALGALADNLRGIGLLAFRGPVLEPLGFTVLVACLGLLAARRVLGQSRRLVAIERELNIAREIQASILPREMPRVAGVRVAARYRPMAAVAGDFYDFLELDERRLGVLVADVSGHGVPAALIASMVKVALASQRARADDPAAVLTGMNEILCGRLGRLYVTAAYLFIDRQAGRMRYGAAGHPPLLRQGGDGGEVQALEKNGLPLGLMAASRYELLEHPLQPGDRFLLYTDGLLEAPDAADEFFGLERAKAAVARGAQLAPDAGVDALLAALDAWSPGPPGDDLTLVLVDCAPLVRGPALPTGPQPPA